MRLKCGEFAPFLYLATGDRCCGKCQDESMIKAGIRTSWMEYSRMPWPDSDDDLELDGDPDINKTREFIGIKFPHMRPDNMLEDGHSYKGCEWEYLQYESDQLLYDMSLSGQKEYLVTYALRGRGLRAWPGGEFLKHVEECYGAQQLLSSIDDREPEE
ncbi:TPA_exp: hypothetical protein A8136_2611 [Trichophyton benhamiae CBS 112371]|nr:TPA_exp: hypothetical protein A8136_2611 [Trichophyton benhamiae CBS 112371]